MRWGMVLMSLLALVGGAGCPHAFGKGGTIDRAVHKDDKRRLAPPKQQEVCPSQEELDQLCAEPEDPICPIDCLEQ